MIGLNKRIANVDKPHWMDEPFEMGQNLLYMIIRQRMLKRHISKITIEAMKPTQIEYVIIPGRWIDRMYDNGMMRRGTL